MAEKLLTGAKMMLYNKIYDKSEVRVYDVFNLELGMGKASEAYLGM